MLCIISAFSKEIEPLLSRSGASKKDNNLWTIDRKQILIAAVGIGFLEASLNLNKILTLHSEIRSVIFTGSAGVYPDVPDIEIDDLCTCSDTILCDGAAEMGLGLYASILPKDPLEASYKKIEAKRRARVATLLSLTKDNGLANTIRNNTNAELENMELYGIAKTCLELPVYDCRGTGDCYRYGILVNTLETIFAQGIINFKDNVLDDWDVKLSSIWLTVANKWGCGIGCNVIIIQFGAIQARIVSCCPTTR